LIANLVVKHGRVTRETFSGVICLNWAAA
jgi:hypothetical protein